MKKILIVIAVMGLIIGMTAPSIGSSKYRKAVKATTTEVKPEANCNQELPPPPNWQIPVYITDMSIDCPAKTCHWVIAAFASNQNCQVVPVNWITYVPVVTGQSYYYLSIPPSYSWVIIKIIPDPTGPVCVYQPNKNYCCEQQGNVTLCSLKICP